MEYLRKSNVMKQRKEQFLTRAREIHGTLYDYSDVTYKNSKIHIDIICNIHGTFSQTPEKHCLGRGCPKCGGTSKKTTEEFIRDAREIHGTRYDYSGVTYKGKNTKIDITCSLHGAFQQLPAVHLRGGNCQKCSAESRKNKTRLDVTELIARFTEAHGNEYDYSELEYVNSSTPLKIICIKHGPFYQRLYEHIESNGCKICHPRDYTYLLKYVTGPLQARKKEFLNSGQVAELVKRRHGQKYDYSKIEFVSRRDKVKIICPIHGEFAQRLENHLYGNGCRQCGYLNSATKRLLSFDSFFLRARSKHNGKYDYNRKSWLGAKAKVHITCPIHGPFYQQAGSHVAGRGCPDCADVSRGDNRRQDPIILLDRFMQKHDAHYEYDLSAFTSVNRNITITCPTHGPFEQTPNNHLAGKGCPLCGNEKIGEAFRSDPSVVVDKFRKVHGDVFDYSLVAKNYVNSDTAVPIICKVHGEFWQIPYNHQAGKSCPTCKESQGERAVRIWLEEHNIEFIKEWTDHDCVNVKTLKFDFFVPQYDAIIEYDGIHHFEVDTRWWEPDPAKRQASFELLALHDWLKDEWCNENGLSMIRIHYEDVVDERLDAIFNQRG